MDNPISISNGFGYRVFDDRNETMRFFQDFPIDGVELMIFDLNSLENFTLDRDVLAYLQGLPFVTIHAPFYEYKRDTKTKKILQHLYNIYLLVNAKNITFHPDTISSFNVLADSGFKVSIENNDRQKVFGFQRPDEIRKLLDQFDFLHFTFDFAHAFQINPDLVDGFLELRERISQIHLSYCFDELSEHGLLHNQQSRELKKKLSLLKNTLSVQIPIILECAALNRAQMNLLGDEIKFVKEV